MKRSVPRNLLREKERWGVEEERDEECEKEKRKEREVERWREKKK